MSAQQHLDRARSASTTENDPEQRRRDTPSRQRAGASARDSGPDWTDSFCPVARTVDLIGDKWSLLIIRDAFDGVRRFSHFQRSLGIARNILTLRLHSLVGVGVLQTRPASDGSGYQEYALTPRGRELFTLVVAMRQWGEEHAFHAGEQHSQLIDKATGVAVPRLHVRSADGESLDPDQTHVQKVEPPEDADHSR